jgi:hypothetical protein
VGGRAGQARRLPGGSRAVRGGRDRRLRCRVLPPAAGGQAAVRRRGGGCRVSGQRGPGHRPGNRHPLTQGTPFRGAAALGEAAGAGGQGPDAGAHADGDRGPHRVLGGVVATLRPTLGQRPSSATPPEGSHYRKPSACPSRSPPIGSAVWSTEPKVRWQSSSSR